MNQVKTIGIVGGGQLAQMLTQAAIKLGFDVVVVDPGVGCPAAQAGAKQIVAQMDSPDALQKLADACDVITIDVEHVDVELLNKIDASRTPVRPAPSTIAMIQDKLRQKEFLRNAGINVADFIEVTDKKSAAAALNDFDGKMIIKTRRGAYDGRGNMVVGSVEEVDKALSYFAGQGLYAEALVDFDKEIAVMIARDLKGNISTYPIVETIQERNICVEVLAPAQISDEAIVDAESLAYAVSEHLEGAGVFGIEMFLTYDGQVLVNEIAPRVHNSGHYTIEGCATSQFEQHIRAISGMELGLTELIVPAVVMINILGERDGPTDLQGVDKAEQNPHTKVHIYGKSPTKVDRKMGHLTSVGGSLEEAREIAVNARGLIKV